MVRAVGACEALLAGLLLKLADGEGMEEALRWGTAAGAATCLTTGTQLCHRADVKRILPDVRVEQSRSTVAAGGHGSRKRQ